LFCLFGPIENFMDGLISYSAVNIWNYDNSYRETSQLTKLKWHYALFSLQSWDELAISLKIVTIMGIDKQLTRISDTDTKKLPKISKECPHIFIKWK
jgi:hypothetical protein